jgi:uncharacterized protein
MADHDLPTRLRAALTPAMKSRDTAAVTAIRTALAAIDNAGSVVVAGDGPVLADGPIAGAVSGLGAGEVSRRELTADEMAAIVMVEVTEREDAAAGYERSGAADRAAQLRAEAAVLRAVIAG